MKKEFIIFLVFFMFFLESVAQNKDIEILDNSNNIKIEEILVLNSSYRETNLSISPDGKYLYFMSDRGGMSWSTNGWGNYNGQPRFDGDIWRAKKIEEVWQKPEALDNNVNTSNGEDEPNVSPDGQFVTYQSWEGSWNKKGGPYYTSVLTGEKWSQPVGLGGGICDFFYKETTKYLRYATDGMTISPDKKTFLVACGENYDGSLDIYMSKFENNKWTYLKAVDFNTKYDERSIFIAGDGKTIFFASNGHGGFGKLDIFKATLNEDGSITDIKNIGEPFNTKDNDYGFIITASGKEAYFVRNGNIFYADLSKITTELTPTPTTILNGLIIDCNDKKIETTLALYYLDDSTKIGTSKSSFDGLFSFSFAEKTGNFKIQNSEKSAYKFDTTFEIKALGTFQEIYVKLDICKNKNITFIKKDSLTTQNNNVNIFKNKDITLTINFDFDKDILKTEYNKQIEDFMIQLKNVKNYKIEIIGYTDSKGDDAYNLKLGKKRANSVQNYITNLGFDKTKITTKTDGEKNPVADNETEEGAFKNRRVEVKISY